jgi:hypothetical protein
MKNFNDSIRNQTRDLSACSAVPQPTALPRAAICMQVWMSLIQTCTTDGYLYTVTYIRCRIDTINSSDDGHVAARNM